MQVIKTVKKYGNSGGIYLPTGWVGGKVSVELIEKPPDPRTDLLNLPLEHVICIILYGSYARHEMEEGSDIDVLLVVDEDSKMRIPMELRQKYDIQIISVKEVRNLMVHDPVFYKVIADEALALINHQFLDILRREVPSVGGIKTRLDLVESSLSISNEILASGGTVEVVYPLILRLKETLILEYLLDDTKYSTGDLKKEVLRHGISPKEFSIIMEIYRAARHDKRLEHVISKEVVEKLISLLEMKIRYVKQKTREKRY